MTPQIIYYTFSIAIFSVFVIHVTNLVYYKRKGKTLIGMSFKKGSVEYKRMQKASSSPFIWIAIAALPLSFINLLLAIRDVFQMHDRGNAVALLVAWGLVVVVTFGIVISVLRSMFTDNKDKSSYNNRNDDDW